MPTVEEKFKEHDDALLELGYVLKAIEELSVEKQYMTRTEIQNKILELSEEGWAPEGVRKNNAKN